MKIFICVDDAGGVLFNHRRQSMDRVLRARVAEISADGKLWMSRYSAGQFTDVEAKIENDDFLQLAAPEDYCFVEDKLSLVNLEHVDKVYLFHWNRRYPADMFFKRDLPSAGFRKIAEEEFAGSSHEKITLEVFEK